MTVDRQALDPPIPSSPRSRRFTIDKVAIFVTIGAYWCFYVAISTIRSLVVNLPNQPYLLELRVIVGLANIAITVLLYGALAKAAPVAIGRRIGFTALACVPAAAASAAVNATIYQNVDPCSDQMSWQLPSAVPIAQLTPGCHESWWIIFADHVVTGYFLVATWAALYLALCFAAEAVRWEREAADQQAATQTAELRALRYQINPHFMFNTLNSLSSLIISRRNDDAEEMVTRLASFFRASLAGDPTKDITLAQEIELQHLYLAIEAKRFPRRLRSEISLPDGLRGFPVPGLLLQPLVENAIKHGVARSDGETTIRIEASDAADRIAIVVSDDGGGGMPLPRADGIGLRNVAERLRARYGSGATCEAVPTPTGFRATIGIPVLSHAA